MTDKIHPLYKVLFKAVPYTSHPSGRKFVAGGPGMSRFTEGTLPERVLRYLAAHQVAGCVEISEGIDASYGHTRACLLSLHKNGEVQCIQVRGSHPAYGLAERDEA